MQRQGTTRRATRPPSSSASVATPCGTTHSPSTRRLNRCVPGATRSARSHTSPPTATSGAGRHWFQSPAIATARAPVNRNRTTMLSPRRSGTSGASGGTERAVRRPVTNRTAALMNRVRGNPWYGSGRKPPAPTSTAVLGETNTCRNPLAAPLEPYTAESRAAADALAVTVPRCQVTPVFASVNHAPRNRLGSTLADQSVLPPALRHHVRARARNADTQGDPAIHPAEGPAPTPTPQRGAAHRSSATAYGAAVSTPAVPVLPVHPASRPTRIASVRGGVVTQP